MWGDLQADGLLVLAAGGRLKLDGERHAVVFVDWCWGISEVYRGGLLDLTDEMCGCRGGEEKALMARAKGAGYIFAWTGWRLLDGGYAREREFG